MDFSKKEAPFKSVGALIYTIFASLSFKSGNGAVRIKLEGSGPNLDGLFYLLKLEFGKDFEVLNEIEFEREGNGPPRSAKLKEVMDHLCENGGKGGLLYRSERAIEITRLASTEAWFFNQLKQTFGSNTAKWLRFDEMVCRFREILLPD